MFRTLRARIALAMVGVVLLTTLAIFVMSQRQTTESMIALQDGHVRSILETVRQAVNNEYQSIEFYRNAAINQRKTELKRTVEIAFGIIGECKEMADTGQLTETQAQERAKGILRHMRWDNEGSGYLWINTNKRQYPTMLMHPTIPDMVGKLMDNPIYNCTMGTNENIFFGFYDLCSKNGEGFLEYRWPKPLAKGLTPEQHKLSFVKLYQPWDWIVGAGVYIDDVQKNVDARVNAVIEELRNMSAQFKVGESGYMFILNGNGDLLIHPTLSADESRLQINPDTNNSYSADIIASKKKGHAFFDYPFPRPGFPPDKLFAKRAYILHYEPLNWYICISVYLDDFKEPVNALTNRIMAISGIFIAIGLIVSLYLGSSLATPLKKLAAASEQMSRRQLDTPQIPIGGTSEIRELGQILTNTFREISEKEKEIRDNERNLRITLDSIGDGVISTDTNGKIIRMNKVAEILTGCPADGAKGRYFLDVVKLIDSQTGLPVDNPIHEAMSNGESFRPHNSQNILISGSGTKTLISDNCRQIRDESGQTVGIVFAFRDVTEQNRIEEQLRQSQKMDSLGQLAGGIAHDFNNMLAGIIGSVELLEDCLKDNKEAKEYLEMILKCCRQVSGLTEKLLAFSRKGKLLSTPIDVHASIESGISILQRSLDKRISINKNLSARKSTVVGDPSQLQNVILNLGINAGHAMPVGGTLTISTENVDLQTPINAGEMSIMPGEYIKISVQDTGVGMSQDVMKKIFEPFFTTKGVGKGTGLGLAAVYGSVKEHHGAINVQSRENEGTVFEILLPVAETRMAIVEQRASTDTVTGQGCILLVDDETIIRRTAKQMLEDMGYQVILASDGQEALEIYEKGKDSFDMVILDMVMPKMCGADCFRKIRQINPNAKVMASSGFAGDSGINELKKEGLIGFIKKPYGRLELGKIVRNILNGASGWQ